ncbi:hypothetical protein ACIBD9_23040 [Micromonospora sp. NPDC050784]|uniref:hypothetical protein n=1 Tax=Micromonospora sp. NPDC050784 TaxID=3364281 RepID=UPI0037AC8B5A
MRHVGPDERGRLFEQAREWSRRPDSWANADRLWIRVIDTYRQAAGGPDCAGRHDQQQLARALRRRGMLLSARGRAAEGMAPGGEAVAIFERVYDAVAAEGGNVAARQAMGAAYHHQASALLHRHLTRPSSLDGLRDAVLAAALTPCGQRPPPCSHRH